MLILKLHVQTPAAISRTAAWTTMSLQSCMARLLMTHHPQSRRQQLQTVSTLLQGHVHGHHAQSPVHCTVLQRCCCCCPGSANMLAWYLLAGAYGQAYLQPAPQQDDDDELFGQVSMGLPPRPGSAHLAVDTAPG